MKKGDRITITGYGRTAHWPEDTIGTVTMKRGDSIFVHWDDTSFEDQMDIKEVCIYEGTPAKKNSAERIYALEQLPMQSEPPKRSLTMCGFLRWLLKRAEEAPREKNKRFDLTLALGLAEEFVDEKE